MPRLVSALLCLFFFPPVSGLADSGLPYPSGPYAIGRVTFAWTDPSRLETMPGNHGENRELLVHIYYPRDASAQGAAAAYFPNLKEQEAFENQRFGNSFFKNTWGPAYAALSSTTHAMEGVDLARGGAKFPVVVFSHGAGIPVLFYSAMLESLASSGYVVAAVEHSYDGELVVFPDGHIVEQSGWDRDPKRSAQERIQFHRSRYEAGAKDNSFVLDQLAKLNTGDKRFRGRLNLEETAAVGHSLGGMISIFSCSHDRRFKACASLDSGLDNGEIYPAVSQPMMAVFGGLPPRRAGETDDKFKARELSFRHELDSLVAAYRNAVSSDVSVALMSRPGYSHFSYFDMPTAEVTGPWVATTEEWTSNKEAINRLLFGFLQQNLLGKKNALQRAADAIPGVKVQSLATLRRESAATHTR